MLNHILNKQKKLIKITYKFKKEKVKKEYNKYYNWMNKYNKIAVLSLKIQA